MGTVNTWVGAIGGAILGIELILGLIVLVAINLVLALGLRWVLRKQGLVHDKITWALSLVDRSVNKGAGVAATPVIKSTSVWRGLKAALHRATHWPKAAQPPAPQLPAQPSTPEESRAA